MSVTQKEIDRINELARKVKSGEKLTPQELAERDELRKRYIQAFRESLRGNLDNIDLVDEKGHVVEHVADRYKGK